MLRTFRIGGIHPPENKLSAGKKITALAAPKQVIIPLSQHIGAPAQAVVKKGDLAAYRQALSFITRETVAHKLFKEIAPEYAQRNGGYTRIIRTGIRRGDAAETAIIELVK